MNKFLMAFVFVVFCGFVSAADIQLTWDKSELRTDGSQIEILDRYNLYHTIDGVGQGVIEINSNDTSHTVSEAIEGVHSFQISAVEKYSDGELESKPSEEISVTIDKELSLPAQMNMEVIVEVKIKLVVK